LLTIPCPQFDMATGIEKLRTPTHSSGFLRTPVRPSLASQSIHVSGIEPHAIDAPDLFIFRHGSDSSWTAKLADCLRRVRLKDRNLRLSLADWNDTAGANVLLDAQKNAREGQLLVFVVSRSMLQKDWRPEKRIMDLLQEIHASGKRLVAIVKDNVSVPPVLRLGEWFDFRNEDHFEERTADLASFLVQNMAFPRRDCSFGVSPAKERILCNVFPVVELPQFIYSAETRFKNESELTDACAEDGPSSFLIRNSRIYALECPSQDSKFAFAADDWNTRKQENFMQWFSNPERAKWGIELLNKLFRRHAWKRGLRWDSSTNQFFFPRNKPKSIWWKIGEQTVAREVTAPHMGWIDLENEVRAEVQYGWKHQSVRADFVKVRGSIFFRLQPGWLLTKLDSKTPAMTRPVAACFSEPQSQEKNGQILRSWRFWSTVLAKGHHEIRINTGQAPVRTRLTPISVFSEFGVPGDRLNYDQMMQTAIEDDLLIPPLGTFEQEIIQR
jgi:hypothetical protein